MSPRHPVRAASVLATTLLLALSGAAYAQPDIPPSHNDLPNGRPWTYQFGRMILAGALLLLVAIVLGYLVKSRQFRANAKRGGSK
jgi:H+/gluconate symporter-like permease